MLSPFPFLKVNRVCLSQQSHNPINHRKTLYLPAHVMILKSDGRSSGWTGMRYLSRSSSHIICKLTYILFDSTDATLSVVDTKSPTRCLHTISSHRLKPPNSAICSGGDRGWNESRGNQESDSDTGHEGNKNITFQYGTEKKKKKRIANQLLRTEGSLWIVSLFLQLKSSTTNHVPTS